MIALNDPQREAVHHERGPVLVLAGAGSGKTRVITCRIAHLVRQGVQPHRLLAVTFTNKAAGEMRERAGALLGYDLSPRGLWIGTFHSICARLLRMHGSSVGLSPDYVVYDTADQRSLIARILKDLDISERLFTPAEMLGHIDRAKNDGIGPRQYQADDFVTDAVAKVYPAYERRLLAANAVDFGNLLLKTVELLRHDSSLAAALSDRFQHLLVDEFQDTNPVQYELVRILSQRHHNLCVVGDDDQAIYSWRGANIRNILDFERDHPGAKVVKLEQNYRSTQTILDGAFAVISKNYGRKPKRLWTDSGAGAPIIVAPCTDERDEAQFVAQTIRRQCNEHGLRYGDIAVFYRTHAQSRVLEEGLRAATPPIPHVVVGGVRFYDRAEIKDLLAYLRLAANPADDVGLLRIINTPARGIGKTTVDKVAERARAQGVSLFEAAQLCSGCPGPLGTAARKKLSAFCELMRELMQHSHDCLPAELAELALERSGYLDRLAADDSPESESRSENLMELIGSMRDYEQRSPEPTLSGYLEQVALASDVDTYVEDEGAVTLMTVHGAKGLEFPVVLIVGMEQGMFPSYRAINEGNIEEERRLAYVAITRARRQLYVCNAARRWIFGQQQVKPASDFLLDLPSHLIETAEGRFRAPKEVDPWPQPLRRPSRAADEVWVDYDYDQTSPDGVSKAFEVGMRVRHKKYGVGKIRVITGSPPDLNLTIAFQTGPKTIRCQYVEPA